MKPLTHPRFIILAMVIAIVGVGIWLDRRETSIRDGRVVIDEAFLHRLQTDDEASTRDPAIKILSAATFKGDILRDMLITGAVTVDLRRLDRDSVEVTLRESFNADSNMVVAAYRRHRWSMWEWFSPASWKEPFRYRGYWRPHSLTAEAPHLPLPPQSTDSP